MRFGKRTLFLALHGMAALLLLGYGLVWLLLGSTVAGKVKPPLAASTMLVQYQVGEKVYRQDFMRTDVPLAQRQVAVRYLRARPSVARIHSFMGMWAELLAWWVVFLLASAMLLLTNNLVFSRGTRFQLHRGFPWITMDEYFPAAAQPHGHTEPAAPHQVKKIEDGWRKRE